MSIDDMEGLKKKRYEEIRPVKNIWYDQLINDIPDSIRKSVGGFKDKIVHLCKTNTSEQTVYGRGKKIKQIKNAKH